MSLPSSKASLVARTVKNLPAMQETLVWSLDWEDVMEKRMATHSSILAWRIPQTEEPAGLQSIASTSVRHDWTTNTFPQKLPATSHHLQQRVWKSRSCPSRPSTSFRGLCPHRKLTLNVLHPMSQPLQCVLPSLLFVFFFLLLLLLSPELRFLFLLFSSSGLPFLSHFPLSKSYSGPSLVVQMIKNLPTMQEAWVWSRVRKIPWRREWQPTAVFLPRDFHRQSSLAGYSPWGRKDSDTTERLHSLQLVSTDFFFCLLFAILPYYYSYFETR